MGVDGRGAVVGGQGVGLHYAVVFGEGDGGGGLLEMRAVGFLFLSFFFGLGGCLTGFSNIVTGRGRVRGRGTT